MGNNQSNKVGSLSKPNKDHHRQKMFRFGISFGRNDLNLERVIYDYNTQTVKRYSIHQPTQTSQDSLPVPPPIIGRMEDSDENETLIE